MRTDQATPQVGIETRRTPFEASPRRQGPWLVVALVLAVTLVAAGTVAFAWRSDLRNAERARDAAVQQAVLLSARVDRLDRQLGTEVPELEERLATARRALRSAHAELAGLAGPALPDGRHIVRIVAVGDDQAPPRLIVDLQRWFTDQAAVDAAIEDGVPAADAGINGYFIRNENPRWRIVEIAPGAPVALTTYPHGQIDDPGMVDLARLRSLFLASDEYVRYSPFWITVRDGTVVGIHEQYIP
jgi:hypothetical protein